MNKAKEEAKQPGPSPNDIFANNKKDEPLKSLNSFSGAGLKGFGSQTFSLP